VTPDRISCFVALAMTIAVAAQAIEPTMDVFIEGSLRPIIHGSTNLPDGSELIVSISRRESKYKAQSKVKVADGHFATERFSSKAQPLNPGRYKIEVSMSVAQLQPEQVQAVIGDRGQTMSGKLVMPSQIGGLVFNYVTVQQLGGPTNATLDAASRVQAASDKQKWVMKSCADTIDLANAAVRSGLATGHEVVGAERKARIDSCITEVNKP